MGTKENNSKKPNKTGMSKSATNIAYWSIFEIQKLITQECYGVRLKKKAFNSGSPLEISYKKPALS